MVETWVPAYLARLGVERVGAADDATLRMLHRAHVLSVPFENLSIHLGEDIVLTEEALVDKIIFTEEMTGYPRVHLGLEHLLRWTPVDPTKS